MRSVAEVLKVCPTCGVGFTTKRKRQVYCSRPCKPKKAGRWDDDALLMALRRQTARMRREYPVQYATEGEALACLLEKALSETTGIGRDTASPAFVKQFREGLKELRDMAAAWRREVACPNEESTNGSEASMPPAVNLS